MYTKQENQRLKQSHRQQAGSHSSNRVHQQEPGRPRGRHGPKKQEKNIRPTNFPHLFFHDSSRWYV
jgi:hypothetical protein